MANRPPGRTKLIQAARIQNNKEMGTVIEQASLDDLEWFAVALEHQLEETPHWVTNERHLHEIQAWTRRVRSMVAELLHDKRMIARKRARALEFGKGVFFVILGVVLGWALAGLFPIE